MRKLIEVQTRALPNPDDGGGSHTMRDPPNVILLIHEAAAGDDTARTELTKKYRRFVRKMAYAFLRAWSPSATRGTLGHGADDIAAEVEQRVFVGTARARPAIERYKIGGKRTRPVLPGKASKNQGNKPTDSGSDKAASFSTWLAGVVRNVARNHIGSSVRQARGALAAAEDIGAEEADAGELADFFEGEAGDDAESADDDIETRQVEEEQEEALQAAIPQLRAEHRDVLYRRQQGHSYRKIADDTGGSIKKVMSDLHRARTALERISGVELRGLVGKLRDDMGGAVPSARGRPRKNPEDGDENDIYFETLGDLTDMLEEDLIDEDMFLAAFLHLCEHRPDLVE